MEIHVMNLVNDSSTSVVGGGTAGLPVAARLLEDPNVQVLVLEAGNGHSNDVNVLAPGLFATLYGNPEYDWNYQNEPLVRDSVHF
jgi:choline dehydrogenase-like flavoprotein